MSVAPGAAQLTSLTSVDWVDDKTVLSGCSIPSKLILGRKTVHILQPDLRRPMMADELSAADLRAIRERRKLFIGGLNFRTSDVDLHDAFVRFGRIESCRPQQA